MLSVMPLQMPEPPPVQNKTFPWKISFLNTDVDLTRGAETAVGAIVELEMAGGRMWHRHKMTGFYPECRNEYGLGTFAQLSDSKM